MPTRAPQPLRSPACKHGAVHEINAHASIKAWTSRASRHAPTAVHAGPHMLTPTPTNALAHSCNPAQASTTSDRSYRFSRGNEQISQKAPPLAERIVKRLQDGRGAVGQGRARHCTCTEGWHISPGYTGQQKLDAHAWACKGQGLTGGRLGCHRHVKHMDSRMSDVATQAQHWNEA